MIPIIRQLYRVPHTAVIPAKAGIHLALAVTAKMDSRFRGNDGKAKQCCTKHTLIKPKISPETPPHTYAAQ
ncbi:hypothetical protein GCM10007901_40520 [Dyella acidisoli]|uniref:Uncharacterized protein n=1 Tax=Dyella acidisoli TaxID=1867834 RepID=A0ABQ5XXK9_9GAMM|nr:hypothetical protein GCM10007901_40520 [Dyella acidisoli]